MVFNATFNNFSVISWRPEYLENKTIDLSQITRPTRCYNLFIVLADRNNSPRVDTSLHSDPLSRFRTNQSLLLLFNAAMFKMMRASQAKPGEYYRYRNRFKCLMFYATFNNISVK